MTGDGCMTAMIGPGEQFMLADHDHHPDENAGDQG